MITLHRIVVTLNGFPALAELDLQVNAGELVLVQGPNGAGKTTLLRTIAGLLPLSSGAGTVADFDLNEDRREVRKHVGFLGHANGLYDDLTVEDNVRFAVRAGRGDLARIPGALESLGLAGRLQRLRVGACSAGQRRRVALAGLLVRSPQVWLLDEPHAGLDADSRDVLDNVIRGAAAKGSTVLVSSHETERVSAFATRSITIAGGHVQRLEHSVHHSVQHSAQQPAQQPAQHSAQQPAQHDADDSGVGRG